MNTIPEAKHWVEGYHSGDAVAIKLNGETSALYAPSRNIIIIDVRIYGNMLANACAQDEKNPPTINYVTHSLGY